jgi:uncharacterized protein
MPSKSASQHNLMEAAAHTSGGYGGVPQKVGKEYVKADDATGSTRRVDVDGRLHIGVSNITKATVNGYLGSEIPNGGALGLNGGQIYQLLRCPIELEKAVQSANNIQLMRKHVAVSADDPKKLDIVGSSGTDAAWNPPYITNSLVVWDSVAIAGIDTEEQTELSCSYRYVADMTPGEYQGQKYDGVMRDIIFNHIALVESGRAGHDVIVGDSILNPKEPCIMPIKLKAALAAAAADFTARAADLASKMAKDASLKPLHSTYVKFAMDAKKASDEADEDEMVEEGKELPVKAKDESGQEQDDDAERKQEAEDKKAKDKAAYDKKAKDAKRAKDGEGGNTKAEEEVEGEKSAKDKKAMDAAILSAVQAERAHSRDLREAEKAVRPYVGELTMAFDSADAVYKFALDAQGIKTEKVHPSAFPVLLENCGRKVQAGVKPRFANDAANGPSAFLQSIISKNG